MKALVVVIAVVIAVVTITGAALLRTPGGKHALGRIAGSAISKIIHQKVTIESIEGSLLRDIKIRNVDLRNEREQLLAHVPRVAISYTFKARPVRIVIESLRVADPALNVEFYADGGNSWQSLFPRSAKNAKKQESTTSRYEVRKIEINNVTIEVIRPEGVGKDALVMSQLALHFAAGFPEQLSLPDAHLALDGTWEGKVTHARLSIVPSRVAPKQALSGILKGPPGRKDVDLDAGIGKMQVRLKGNVAANYEVSIERAALVAGCPLFEVNEEGTLRFENMTDLPVGAISARGCAGKVSYKRGAHDAVIDVVQLNLKPILQAWEDLRGGGPAPKDAHDVMDFVSNSNINAKLKIPADPRQKSADLRIGWQPRRRLSRPMNVMVDAHVRDTAVTSRVALHSGNEALHATIQLKNLFLPGTWTLSPSAANGKVSLRSDHLEVSALPDFGLSPFLAQGNLALDATLSGSMAAPIAALKLRGSSLSSSAAGAKVDAEVGITYVSGVAKGGVTIFSSDTRAKQLDGRITARVPPDRLTSDPKAALTRAQIQGELNSKAVMIDSLVPLLTDSVEFRRGILNAAMRFGGTVSQPEYSGTVEFNADSMRGSGSSVEYRDLRLRLKGDNTAVALEELSAKTGKGTLRATGALKDQFRINANLKEFDVFRDPDIRINLTGDLRASVQRNLTLSGNFAIRDGAITLGSEESKKSVEPLDELEDVVLPQSQKTSSNEDKARSPGLRGAIDVKAPGHVWFRSSDRSINIELGADLQFGFDSNSDLFAKGGANAVRGNAVVFGKRFDVRKALVSFAGDPAKPILDAEAIHTAGEYKIVVAANGPVSDLKLKVSSDPPSLSEEQAIGVLLTGNPDFERRGGAGDASGIATSILAGQIMGKLGAKLPFDTFTAEVGSPESGQSGKSASQANSPGLTKVELGKYVSERMFVSVAREFDTRESEASDKLKLEYRLSDRWSIETGQSDRGRSELGVTWTHSY